MEGTSVTGSNNANNIESNMASPVQQNLPSCANNDVFLQVKRLNEGFALTNN